MCSLVYVCTDHAWAWGNSRTMILPPVGVADATVTARSTQVQPGQHHFTGAAGHVGSRCVWITYIVTSMVSRHRDRPRGILSNPKTIRKTRCRYIAWVTMIENTTLPRLRLHLSADAEGLQVAPRGG